MNPENPVHEVVIAHGKNWREYPPAGASPDTFTLHLSLESKMTALAASELYHQGKTKKVLFSTGDTAGRNFPSESQAMIDYLARVGRSIPEEDVLMEEVSFDTPGNAEESKRIVEKHGLHDVALLTVSDHLPRTADLYVNYGQSTSTSYASETIVQHISPHHEKFVNRYAKSPRRRLEQVKEFILRTETRVDKKGVLPRLLTKKIRHQ